MAEQINSKFNQTDDEDSLNNKDVSGTSQPHNDSVDLDNLFAFLSEVTPNSSTNPLIYDISEKMDSLVQDLDNEIEQRKGIEKELTEDVKNLRILDAISPHFLSQQCHHHPLRQIIMFPVMY
ncbi:Myo22.2 family protein [Megaselia abdita]